MSDKLRECKKKCPLCGQTAWIKEVHLVNEDMASLFCSCGFHIERSGSIGTMGKIIKLLLSKWNTRHEPKHETVDALEGVIKAWEGLRGNKSYTPDVVNSWLSVDMKPSIDKCREVLANHHGNQEDK